MVCSATLMLAPIAPVRGAIAAPAREPSTATSVAAPEPAEPREVAIVRVPASEDEVIMIDGSFVRGKVVELAKGSHVTISLGEPRTIPWAEVQEVRLATAPEQPPVATAPAPAEPSPMPTGPDVSSEPGRPRVHIETRNGRTVNLYSVEGEFVGSGSAGSVRGIAFRSVCSGTCDQVVDGTRGNPFFVGGDGVTPSRRFTLTNDTGRLTLDVKAGRRAAYMSGLVLTPLGATLLALGATFISISKPQSEYYGLERKEGERKAGIGMVVAGSLGLVSGIVLMVVSRTIVKKRREG